MEGTATASGKATKKVAKKQTPAKQVKAKAKAIDEKAKQQAEKQTTETAPEPSPAPVELSLEEEMAQFEEAEKVLKAKKQALADKVKQQKVAEENENRKGELEKIRAELTALYEEQSDEADPLKIFIKDVAEMLYEARSKAVAVKQAPAKKQSVNCGCIVMKKVEDEENPDNAKIWAKSKGLKYGVIKRCGNKANAVFQWQGRDVNCCKAHLEGKKGSENGVDGEPLDGVYEYADGSVAPLHMGAHHKAKMGQKVVKAQMKVYPERYAWLGGENPKDTFRKWEILGLGGDTSSDEE